MYIITKHGRAKISASVLIPLLLQSISQKLEKNESGSSFPTQDVVVSSFRCSDTTLILYYFQLYILTDTFYTPSNTHLNYHLFLPVDT